MQLFFRTIIKFFRFPAAPIPITVLAIGLFAVSAPHVATASGFAINSQSGSGTGNAFAGAGATAEDASTIWYNPAGMVALPGTSLSVTANVLRTSYDFRDAGSTGAFALPGTGEGGDGGGIALVPQGYISTAIGDNVRIGVALNVPFGLKTEYDSGWRGQFVALKSEAKSYNVNPSIAYKVNDTVWLGAGVDYQYFSTTLTNYAGPVAGLAELNAHDTGWGYNLGLMLNASPTTRLGFAYRSQIRYDLQGTANFSGGGGLFNSQAHADLTVPENASVSFFSSVSDRWDVMASAVWTHWSRLQTLTVFRASPSALGPTGSVVAQLPFNWRDTVMFALGTNYKWSDKFKIRFGAFYDPATSNDATRTPRLPDERRILLAVGGRYSMTANDSIDFGYGHEFVNDAAINDRVTGVPGALIGKFDSAVDLVSIQYNHHF